MGNDYQQANCPSVCISKVRAKSTASNLHSRPSTSSCDLTYISRILRACSLTSAEAYTKPASKLPFLLHSSFDKFNEDHEMISSHLCLCQFSPAGSTSIKLLLVGMWSYRSSFVHHINIQCRNSFVGTIVSFLSWVNISLV